MKQIISLFLALALVLCACGKKTEEPATWQEQYDLGVRYLSEGNYEEAILAFEAAIEIDPKQADAYIALAEVYTALGDVGKATEILDRAVAELGTTAGLTAAKAALTASEPRPESTPTPSPEPTPEASFVYNEYGGTEFTQRNSYCDIENLESKEVSVLKEAMALTIANDMHGLNRLWKQCIESSDCGVIRTIMDGYKVEFSFDGRMEFMQMGIQFRPENGTGYAAHITENQGESVWSSRWASCNCSNWQWNGTASLKDEYSHGMIVSGSVPLVDSLRDGIFINNYTYFTTTAVYQDGFLVEYDGNPQVPDNILWGIIGGAKLPIEQSVLDELYW